MCPTDQDFPPQPSNATAQPCRIADRRPTNAEGREVFEKRRADRAARVSDECPEGVQKAIIQTPGSYRDRRTKAVLGLASPKVCIRAFCEQCMGYASPLAEGIRDCQSKACPLYFYRPYQQAGASG